MARRRMFSLDVIDTDAFTDMAVSAQCLYFHLGMHGDDDGFVSSPRRIAKSIGCNVDDLKLLTVKGFIIPFDSGVVVLKDWNVNNTLRNDRYHPTIYQAEKASVQLNKAGQYELVVSMPTKRQPSDNQMEPEQNITKRNVTQLNLENRADKPPRSRFSPPSEDDVLSFFSAQGASTEAKSFIDYYTANGWKVGRNAMKDWKAAARNWIRRSAQYAKPPTKTAAVQQSATDAVARAAERLASGDFSALEGVFV